MPTQQSRRHFLKTTAAVSAGAWLGVNTSSGRAALSANEKLDVACIGIGGRGRANVNGVASQNIVALCDVDDVRAGDAYKTYPKARKYTDYRRMLDRIEKQIDAVVVSTPDHSHFHPAMMAMERGKHLYCEKPMAHSVEEIRRMTDLAREKGVATQLGVQRHTLENMHRVVELIQAGAIGDVSEVYSWVNSSRGMPKVPDDTPPVPKSLDWDLWVGPADYRPYSSTICPYGWRFWWDYGTGEMGNWGCHILDIPFWALGLTYPTRVDASGPVVDPERSPKEMESRFKFAETEDHPELSLHWSQSPGGPPILKELGLSAKGANNLFIGSKGMLLCGFGMRKLLPTDKFASYDAPEPTIPDSPGFHREWIAACKGGQPATCAFDYSGPLAETVILANTAYRAGGGFDWNYKTLEAGGNSRASGLIHPTFRKGWEL